jgi:hypothetical protein
MSMAMAEEMHPEAEQKEQQRPVVEQRAHEETSFGFRPHRR